jgi:hypothetical protein
MNVPLNNNRSNNRRRGRGNNRTQGGGQLNRIDSRARGNAPQLLEKYKKLAHDASLNGDRVQTEYYLQFADHYFRVIADTKARQDEQRVRRDEPRDQSTDGYEDDEFSSYGAMDRGRSPRRVEREDIQSPDNDSEAEGERDRDRPRDRDNDRDRSRGRDRDSDRPRDRDRDSDRDRDRDSDRSEASSEYEPSENPFTRGNRERAPQRRTRKPREQGDAAPAQPATQRSAEPSFDHSILPPAIGERRDTEEEPEVVAEKPRRRRTTRAKTAVEGDSESLQKAD